MIDNDERNRFIWGRFSLREAMLLGFCATFIVITRAALRIHFSLPGHSMFFLTFFLLFARGCVPKLGSSTLVGVIAGIICMLLGMTKMGPLIIANFVLPAMVVDLACFFFPQIPASYVGCLLAGALASLMKALTGVALDFLLGLEAEIIVQHILITSLGSVVFGAGGSLLTPGVIRRLRANRLIPAP